MDKTNKKDLSLTPLSKELRSLKNQIKDPILGEYKKDLPFEVGCQLPTKGDVISYFVYLNKHVHNNLPKEQVAKLVIDKLELIWTNSGIPFSDYKTNRSKDMIRKLFQTYENLKKCINRPNFATQKENYLEELKSLFDIAKLDAETIIGQDRFRTPKDIQADIMFLSDQRGPRKQVMGALDK